MQNKHYRGIILNLFDDSGAGAAPNGEAGGGDGESTGSVTIKPEARARGRAIGVANDLMEDYQKAFFNSSDGAEGDVQEENNEETGQDEDLDAQFEELVKGKYKDAYHKYTEGFIKDRLGRANRGRAELENKVEKAGRVMQLLAEKYGDSDPDKLYDALRGDSEMWRQQAIDRGQTSEEFMESYDRRMDAEAQQRELEELRQYKQVNELDRHLQGLARQTRELYPDFDLETEFSNPKFRAALDMVAAQNTESNRQSGKQGEVYDLTFAYELAHADEIRANQIKRVSKATASAVAQTIQANRSRVQENAGRTTVQRNQRSYQEYTDEEFDAILDKVRRGEARI